MSWSGRFLEEVTFQLRPEYGIGVTRYGEFWGQECSRWRKHLPNLEGVKDQNLLLRAWNLTWDGVRSEAGEESSVRSWRVLSAMTTRLDFLLRAQGDLARWWMDEWQGQVLILEVLRWLQGWEELWGTILEAESPVRRMFLQFRGEIVVAYTQWVAVRVEKRERVWEIFRRWREWENL